jgi:hypothetical protein
MAAIRVALDEEKYAAAVCETSMEGFGPEANGRVFWTCSHRKRFFFKYFIALCIIRRYSRKGRATTVPKKSVAPKAQANRF